MDGRTEPTTRGRLRAQGYSQRDITANLRITTLARWTPAMCGTLGAIGILLESPAYLIILGALTAVGAFSSMSIYDMAYEHGFRKVYDMGRMPKHGPQRRFGCGVGAFLLALSGIGFYLNIPLLAYIPGALIVGLALLAALSQWCFASAIYNRFFGDDT